MKSVLALRLDGLIPDAPGESHEEFLRVDASVGATRPRESHPRPLSGRVEGRRAHKTVTPAAPRFQPPPRRTQRADFPHCAPPFASPQGL